MQAALLLIVLTAIPALCQKVNPELQAENLASCSIESSEPPTRYGLAKGTLVSLWYAKVAASRASEIKQTAQDSDNMFSLVTGLMRVTKTATNDYLCARHSIRPFVGTQNDDLMKTAAEFLIMVYDDHIQINNRMLELYKTLDEIGPEMADKISTLQVERSKGWSDLTKAASFTIMLMVDTNRTDDPSKTTRLAITKEQKQSLLKFIADHFPEFKDGTPKDQWTEPTKITELYFSAFQGRKCADE